MDCSRKIFLTVLIVAVSLFLILPNSFAIQKPSKKPEKTKMLWIDAEQDVFAMSNLSSVRAILDKCTSARINTIALDIKPFSGFVLYNSKIAPKLANFKGKPYPEKFDLLKTVVAEGHKRKLSIHAAINIFSEGLKAEKMGPVFTHPDWESVIYDVSNFIRTSEGGEQVIAEINQRTTDNTLVKYTPDYGKRVFARDEPENVVDENTEAPSSKWVSDSSVGPHWIRLEWATPQKVDTVKLYFVKNHIIPKFRIQYSNNDHWTDLVVIEDNKEINPIYSFAPVNARKIRLLIEDTGIDSIARLMEIGIYSIQGGTASDNLAPEASAYADSSNGRGTTSTFYMVKNDQIISSVEEEDIGEDGAEIPEDGYLISADGKTRAWAKTNLLDETVLTRGIKSRLVPETQYHGGMLVYVNPSNPEVRERELAIIKEIVTNYNIDGIVLDRVRYDNFKTDFSDLSRQQFEQFIGETIKRWPEDIYELDPNNKEREILQGKYYKEWIYWRASNIKDFIVEAKSTVKDLKPNVQFGDYVGSWYPSYYEVGVNWASSTYDPSKEYDWATPGYRGNGYAEFLDYLCPGLYYPELTVSEAMAAGKKDYASLEGGIQLINKIVGDTTKKYASLYYPNIASPDKFKNAVQMSLSKTDGVMIFSMIHFEKENKWDLLKEALTENIQPESKIYNGKFSHSKASHKKSHVEEILVNQLLTPNPYFQPDKKKN